MRQRNKTTASTFGIVIGALAPPIVKQMELHGLRFASEQHAAHCQRMIDSFLFLKIHGMLSEAEKDRIGQRMTKKIFSYVEPTP